MRERWDSRTVFVLASIGSAIGLGNVWRFPYICYQNGGGAFLIPYLVALFTTGIPILILEFSLGNKFAKGASAAFALTGRRKEWLGWFAILIAFVVVCYYTVIIAWSLSYTGYSVNLAWGQNTESFFWHRYLSVSDSPFKIGSISLPILFTLLVSWVFIIASIWKGPKTIGKVVWVIVILPWVILITFVIRGVTLPGAMQGLSFFLTPHFEALKDPSVWLAAYGQVFFSLSIGFGIMIAYASYLPKRSRIVSNAFIIAFADAGTAFVAGIAVFSTLGYYASAQGVPVEGVIAASIPLAFITFPTIINYLPLLPQLFGFLFFIMLFFLGISSAISLVEASSRGIIDKWRVRRTPLLLLLGITGFGIGVVFTTNAGILWLDIVDYFMSNWGLIAVGLLQCILLGYFYNFGELKQHIRETSNHSLRWWDFMVRVISPLVLAVLLGMEIYRRIESAYGGYPRGAETIGGYGLLILLIILSVLLGRKRAKMSEVQSPKSNV